MKIRYFYVTAIIASIIGFISLGGFSTDPNVWGPDGNVFLHQSLRSVLVIVVLTLSVAWWFEERRNTKRK